MTALVLGTSSVADEVRERGETARVVGVGGLLPMPHAPSTRWRVALVPEADVTVFGGHIVVAQGRAGDNTIRALDPRTGTAVWEVAGLGGPTTCGTAGAAAGESAAPGPHGAARLICLTGAINAVDAEPDSHAVLVVGPDGRELARRTFQSPMAVLIPPDRVLRGAVGPRAVSVRVEDAVDGLLRWQAELPRDDVEVLEPVRGAARAPAWNEETGDVAETPLNAYGDGVVVHVLGAGVSAYFDAEGAASDHFLDPLVQVAADGTRVVSALTEAGYAAAATRTDGRTLWRRTTGALDLPAVSDNPVAPILLDRDLGGSRTLGRDLHTGREVWRTGDWFEGGALAQIGDRLIVADSKALRAVDARTGSRLWSTAPVDLFSGVVTDGRRLILAGRRPVDRQDVVLQALDLRTGAEVWTAPLPAAAYSALPTDGRLVLEQYDDDGRTLLGIG